MATLATTIFKVVRPDSMTDSDAESYEFLLQWYGVDGGFYEWMFYDNITREKVTGSIVSANTANVNKVFEKSENVTILTAENLTKNQFEVIKKIVRAKNIFRVYMDGTHERFAIVTSQNEQRLSDNNYNFEIVVQSQNSKIYK